MAETIADKITAWAQTHVFGQTAITRDSEAYNAMVEAVNKLRAEPWASKVIGAEPPQSPAGELAGEKAP